MPEKKRNSISKNIDSDSEMVIPCSRCRYILELKKKFKCHGIAHIIVPIDVCYNCRIKALKEKKYKELIKAKPFNIRNQYNKDSQKTKHNYIKYDGDQHQQLISPTLSQSNLHTLLERDLHKKEIQKYKTRPIQDKNSNLSEANINALFHKTLESTQAFESIKPVISQMFGAGPEIMEAIKKKSHDYKIKFAKKVQEPTVSPFFLCETDTILGDSVQTLDKYIREETLAKTAPTYALDFKKKEQSKYKKDFEDKQLKPKSLKSKKYDKKVSNRLDIRDSSTDDLSTARDYEKQLDIAKKSKIQSEEELTKMFDPLEEIETSFPFFRKSSSESSFSRSHSMLPKDTSDFTYYFLKERELKKTHLQSQKSSSELIKEAKESLRFITKMETEKHIKMLEELARRKTKVTLKMEETQEKMRQETDQKQRKKQDEQTEEQIKVLTDKEKEALLDQKKGHTDDKLRQEKEQKQRKKQEEQAKKQMKVLTIKMEETLAGQKKRENDDKLRQERERRPRKKQEEQTSIQIFAKASSVSTKSKKSETKKEEKNDPEIKGIENEKVIKDIKPEKDLVKKPEKDSVGEKEQTQKKTKYLEAFKENAEKQDKLRFDQDKIKAEKLSPGKIKIKNLSDLNKNFADKRKQESDELKAEHEEHIKKIKAVAEKKAKERETGLKIKLDENIIHGKYSLEGFILAIEQNKSVRRRRLSEQKIPRTGQKYKAHQCNKSKRHGCLICKDSESELDLEDNMLNEDREKEIADIIIGQKILKYKHPLAQEPEENRVVPILFHTVAKELTDYVMPITEEVKPKENITSLTSTLGKLFDQELPKGVIKYALSDRAFIDKGWTMLPTEKVVRKMNVYRMRPAHPEFDWFENNKKKKVMLYDSGETLAEFNDNGRVRWYYRNGRLALDYYEAEESNTQQRIVIYSNGEPDARGRARPFSILATFDYLGNGIVLDHAGKIRLKYNQTEGIILDRSLGPVSHWKWHTLNDPPVLQQVMIDTQMAHKDPNILKLGGPDTDIPRSDNEEMLAIEFDNFIKEKNKKLSQKFKPFQIKMKALKINDNFSLKVLDQASVYLIYRDGMTSLKINIGMILDHKEIVDTDTAEVGEVSNNLQRFPARTDSLAGLQKSVAHAQRVERARMEREKRIRTIAPIASEDVLKARLSKPLRKPLRSIPPESSVGMTDLRCKCYRKPSKNNVYHDTRLL